MKIIIGKKEGLKQKRQSLKRKLRFSTIKENRKEISMDEMDQVVRIVNELSREIAKDFYSSTNKKKEPPRGFGGPNQNEV